MIRKKRFDDEFFGFDSEFEHMRESMEQIMEEMMKRIPESNFETFTKERTRGVYGFSIYVGPNGKPIAREFNNIKSHAQKEIKFPISEEREPLVDIIESEHTITVIVELPGVEKKEISIEGNERKLIIKINTEKKKYFKEIILPLNMDFKKANATYNNGVLEVVAPKGTTRKGDGKVIIT